jgi:hypothetical protein
MGADDPQEARLADALIKAAFATGAAVRIIPAASTVVDGVGAILRYRT